MTRKRGNGTGRTHDRRVSPDPAHQEPSHPLREYLIPTRDADGQSETLQVRCPPSMISQLTVLVSSNRYPWKTPSEAARWCLQQGLDKLAKDTKDPEFHSIQQVFAAWVSTTRVQQENLHFGRYLHDMQEVIDQMLSARAFVPAEKMLDQLKEQIAGLDDPYWRERFREEVFIRYRHALKDAKKDRRVGPRPVEE